MKHFVLPIFFLTTFASVSNNAHADEFEDFELEPLFKDKVWEMSAELGILLTSGNTESSSFIAKLDANHEWQKWRFKYNFHALYKKDEVYVEEQEAEVLKTTAEQYIFTGQSDYEITETDAIFGFVSVTAKLSCLDCVACFSIAVLKSHARLAEPTSSNG